MIITGMARLLELSPKKPAKMKTLDADALIHVDGLAELAIAGTQEADEVRRGCCVRREEREALSQ